MRHNHIKDDNSGQHWGVSSSTIFLLGGAGRVLVQLDDGKEQVRLGINPEHAEAMAASLLAHAAKVRAAKPSLLDDDEISQMDTESQERYRLMLAAYEATEK